MSYKWLIVVMILCLMGGVTAAQDTSDGEWTKGKTGNLEYNCDSLNTILDALKSDETVDTAALNALPLVRASNGNIMTAGDYISTATLIAFNLKADAAVDSNLIFGDAITACNASTTAVTPSGETFNVAATGNANLRSCAGTNCSIVGKATTGQILTVVATDGDWYEVQLDDGTTAYISSSLTVRGPDAVISTDDFYTDKITGCEVAFNIKRGSSDLSIILDGSQRNNVVVDLYRPRETRALRVQGQLDKTFIDTGDPYILQYYSFGVSWPKGTYQLEITLDGKTSKLAWDLETTGDYSIYVSCGN